MQLMAAPLARPRLSLRAQRAPDAPKPAPDAQFEVLAVGGLSALTSAALCSRMKGKKRIRVYQRPGGPEDRVVNLQSSVWSKLPEELRERLRHVALSTWPLQRESPPSLGRPWSLWASELRSELLAFAPELELLESEEDLEQLLQDPCHALVLDSPEPLEPGEPALLARPVTAKAPQAALSCAQRRYALNPARGGGLFSMVLSQRELMDLESPKLQEAMKEGLRIFEAEATGEASFLLRSQLTPPTRSSWQLENAEAPSGSQLLHPWAFLVGEAAGLSNPWPGRAWNACMKSAVVLAQHLKAVAQAIRAGYPVDESFNREYGEELARINGAEVGVHSRQCQASQTAESKTLSLASCLDEAVAAASSEGFQRALQLSRGRLDDEEDCWPRIQHLLSARSFALFDASGSWFMDPHNERPQEQEEVTNAPKDEQVGEARRSYNRGLRLFRAQQGPEASQHFRAAAHLGHGKAAYALGVMLLNGDGIRQDEVRARQYLLQAAGAGEEKAMYNLGLMYAHGIGGQRDVTKAQHWTLMAAERGHVKAMRSGEVKIFGAGPWLDYDPKEMGVDGITQEAEGGNVNAQFKLATMYYEGDMVTMDKAMAGYWFMQAAQAGLDEAQYQISRMLFLGDGLEADEAYGLRFLKEAAQQQHPEAMHNLGVKLYWGEGLETDRRAAATWFLQAAQKELPQAMNNIGWMLYCGDGIPSNTKEALKWLEKAAERGNEEAQYHLLSIRGTMI